MVKRRRLDFSYDAVLCETCTSVDHLCALYPHKRDKDCYLVEKTHEYFVKGQLYERTVSSVWSAFFEQFNAAEVSSACVAKAQCRGLVNAASSVYNWSAYETLVNRLPQDKLKNRFAELVKTCDGEEELWSAYEALSVTKPNGASCYYLMVHAGAGAQEIQDTWSCNGRVEAFKGTFLHKQIELVLQKLGELQWLSGRRRAPVSSFLGESEVLAALKDAAAPWKVMSSLVRQIELDLWDHPTVQSFLHSTDCGTNGFNKFWSWLQAHGSWSPYRAEYSIYDENEQIAGTVDSLWFDESGRIVMVDWKRCRQMLTGDLSEQSQQVFNGKRGLVSCRNSSLPGPCRDFFDVSYNHYLAQQTLYVHILNSRYGCNVARILLVQCHPEVSDDYHEVELTYDSTFAHEMLQACRHGWCAS